MEEHKTIPKTIPLSQIRNDPMLWERAITDEGIEELADNIEDTGMQIHRILVRPLGKSRYGLLAGRRRFLAFKKLGKREIKCEVAKIKDDDAALAVSLSENLHIHRPESREWKSGMKRLWDLLAGKRESREKEQERQKVRIHGSKAEEDFLAPGAKKSAPKIGRPKDKKVEVDASVSKMLGASTRTVTRTRKMYEKLSTAALKAYEAGNLTTKQAEQLSSMSKREQIQQLPMMLRETQEQTVNRRREEKDSLIADDNVRSTVANLRLLKKKADQLQEAAEFFINDAKSKELDWDTILNEVSPDFLFCSDTLKSLQDFLES